MYNSKKVTAEVSKKAFVPVFLHTDLVELSVGTENERQDMKHLDPYHAASLVPFRESVR